MHPGLKKLQESLELRSVSEDRFEGDGNVDSGGRIYGGQVMAQALTAMYQSIPGHLSVHCMQANFLRAGDLAVPVEYRVRRDRDGKSYAARSVAAVQHGREIFTAMASFHCDEQGPAHQLSMPEVPGPQGWVPESQRMKQFVGDSKYAWPVEIRLLDPMSLVAPEVNAPHLRAWLRAADACSDDMRFHQAVFAYASDNPILVPALYPHALTPFTDGAMLATLNHSLWLHRPFRMDDWVLMDVSSDITGSGRAMGRASVFTAKGELVATVVQEGVLRYKPS